MQIEREDIERIRQRISKMTDNDLLRYGQAARYMADPKNNAGG
jgi:hypothetical protein